MKTATEMAAKEFELAIESALGEFGCSDRNPCGGTGYLDGVPAAPFRVLFGDGADCENFPTAAAAIAAAKSYRDEMAADAVATLADEHEADWDRSGSWEVVGTYVARCYGPEGDSAGEVTVSIVAAERGGIDGWGVAETPDECTIYHGWHATRDEAVAAASTLIDALDESAE